MLKTLILVSEREEEHGILGEALRRHNAALIVEPVLRSDQIERFSSRELEQARLIGFCTDILIPTHILHRLGFGAYNVHPGSPAYPGWGAASFAVYDGAKRFGATAHMMDATVDTGTIIGTCLFDVPSGLDQTRLEEMAYGAAIDLFAHLAGPLTQSPAPLPAMDVAWGSRRCTRKGYVEMCRIPPDMRVDELLRRLWAFGAGPNGFRPTTTFQGASYQLGRNVMQGDQPG